MKPTEELKHEHEVIWHMLSGAERIARSISSRKSVDIDKIRNVIEFSRQFTDRCHHAKEEKHFFARLVDRGMSNERSPISVLLSEHQTGRELVDQLESALNDYESGNQEACDSVGLILMQYIALLRAHIQKENNILFPMSDGYLSEDDQLDLEKSFKMIEEDEIGAGVHEKYHHLAHEI